MGDTGFQYLVGSSGLEPPTSRLSGARSNHLSYEPIQFRCISFLSPFVLRSSSGCKCYLTACRCRAWRPTLSAGGDEGNRTLDPLLAGQVLSQLSYTPIPGFFSDQSLKIEQHPRARNVLAASLFGSTRIEVSPWCHFGSP